MKACTLVFLLAAVVLVQCSNTFIGTNVGRPMVYHHDVEYSSKVFRKRVENLYFMMPQVPSNVGRAIQVVRRCSYALCLASSLFHDLKMMAISDHGEVPVVLRGILAYDLTNSGASVNVTQGGIGFNFVNLRMKSDRGTKLHYDVYIYA